MSAALITCAVMTMLVSEVLGLEAHHRNQSVSDSIIAVEWASDPVRAGETLLCAGFTQDCVVELYAPTSVLKINPVIVIPTNVASNGQTLGFIMPPAFVSTGCTYPNLCTYPTRGYLVNDASILGCSRVLLAIVTWILIHIAFSRVCQR